MGSYSLGTLVPNDDFRVQQSSKGSCQQRTQQTTKSCSAAISQKNLLGISQGQSLFGLQIQTCLFQVWVPSPGQPVPNHCGKSKTSPAGGQAGQPKHFTETIYFHCGTHAKQISKDSSNKLIHIIVQLNSQLKSLTQKPHFWIE